MITLQLSNVFALHTIWMLARNKVFTLFRAENWSNILCGILPKCVIIAIVWYWMLMLQNRAHTKKRTVTPLLLISYQNWPPSPLSETDRVQSIKLPKSPHFLLLPVGFPQRICWFKNLNTRKGCSGLQYYFSVSQSKGTQPYSARSALEVSWIPSILKISL